MIAKSRSWWEGFCIRIVIRMLLIHRRMRLLVPGAVAAICLALVGSGCGDADGKPAGSASWVRRWNQIAIDASGLDHTPPQAGESRVYGENPGPGRSSRAMAIVHVAMFEAVNAVHRGFETYVGLPPAPPGVSLKAAIAQAAHDTLAALYPAQTDRFAAELQYDLDHIDDGVDERAGVVLGQDAARAILALRANDGAQHAEPLVDIGFPAGDGPGEWRQDPVSRYPSALGAYWGLVRPFVIPAADVFRVAPPPPLDSIEYAIAFDEARALGGDGVTTPTVRTEEEAFVGTFWAYDGTPSLCAPPRLYNQIANSIADAQGLDLVANARLLALVNVALADAGIAIWESKYHYRFWRPVTAIREADADGNSETEADPAFTPLGAPASNLTVPNFTPPFPAYPSGHAGFGGALFQVLREFFGRDDLSFEFVSDEFNGRTRDNQGNLRPRRPRRFSTLSEAEEENGQSRIYLGIHWNFDKTAGIAQGNAVARHVVANLFRPLR
jgi:membrane-associated phospholipid phosphatase